MITGYTVAPCAVCGAKQKDLHLKTVNPCQVRCGMCGHKGEEAATPGNAVFKWNDEWLMKGDRP